VLRIKQPNEETHRT